MMSPMKYIKDLKLNSNCRVLCMIAEQESPEFYRQSQELSEVSTPCTSFFLSI